MMDDLGAGYGSLQRLRNFPFRAAKLDHGLIEDVRHAPVRLISFAGALVQLAHDLEMDVVVEGLESDDLVEAAAILGANGGQGYALGQAMPAEMVAGWEREFVWTIDPQAPRTTLGALATVWCASHRSGNHQEPIERCPITRFLEWNGHIGGPIDAAHRALHQLVAKEGRHGPRYRESVRQLQRDLAGTLTASA